MRPRRSSLVLVGVLAAVVAWGEDLVPVFSQFRTDHWLAVPALDPVLSASAQARADELARQGVLSHGEGEGHRAGDELGAQGYPPGTFGEVLGAGPDVGAVWKAWLASLPHRAVLGQPGWVRWGWGRSLRGSTEVWVLRFWRP